jgi:hypothetical protein
VKRSYTKPFLKMNSGGPGSVVIGQSEETVIIGDDAVVKAAEAVEAVVEAADTAVTVEEVIEEEVVVPAVDYVAMWTDFASQYNVGGLIYGDSSTYPAGFVADNPDTWINAVITE